MTEREQQRLVNHRLAVIQHAREVTGNVAQTCRYFGISRHTFYVWLRRYQEKGLEGLRNMSSRPHHSPNATSAEVVGKIIYLRQNYHFGPAKISMYLKRYHDIEVSPHTIVAIDNAAHRHAQQALDAGDPAETTWAASKGLLATGACEQCYRNLMRAALAEGNHVAFEATYEELLAVTDADDGPDAISYLEPETNELYERATRRRRRQAG